jgi:hypothetical protein
MLCAIGTGPAQKATTLPEQGFAESTRGFDHESLHCNPISNLTGRRTNVANVTRLMVIVGLVALLVAAVDASQARPQSFPLRPPDTAPPTAPVVDGSSETEETEPQFAFSSSDRRTPPDKIRFRCSIDDSTLHPCRREHSERLDFGKHLLRVQAVDRAGNHSRISVFPFVVVGVWDAARDFSTAPNEANPNPDAYGNLTWTYMWSDGRVHDPGLYRRFSHYTVVDASREQWDNGDSHGTPFSPWPLVGFDRDGRRIFMHPYTGQFAVLGWTSPVNGAVDFDGSFASIDPCSRGIDWTIDNGPTIVLSGHLGGGQGQAFNGELAVTSGESLYFVVDPAPDDLCDTTAVTVTIKTSTSLGVSKARATGWPQT